MIVIEDKPKELIVPPTRELNLLLFKSNLPESSTEALVPTRKMAKDLILFKPKLEGEKKDSGGSSGGLRLSIVQMAKKMPDGGFDSRRLQERLPAASSRATLLVGSRGGGVNEP